MKEALKPRLRSHPKQSEKKAEEVEKKKQEDKIKDEENLVRKRENEPKKTPAELVTESKVEKEKLREKYREEDTYHYKSDAKLPIESRKKCSNFLAFKKAVHRQPEIGKIVEFFREKYDKEIIDIKNKQFSADFVDYIVRGTKRNKKLGDKLLYMINKVNAGRQIAVYIEEKKKQEGTTLRLLAESCFFVSEEIPEEFSVTNIDTNSIAKWESKSDGHPDFEPYSECYGVDLIEHQITSKESRERWLEIAAQPQTEIPVIILNDMDEHAAQFNEFEGEYNSITEPIPGKTLVANVKTTGKDHTKDEIIQVAFWMLDHSSKVESEWKIQKVLNVHIDPISKNLNRVDEEGRSLKDRFNNFQHFLRRERYKSGWKEKSQVAIDHLWSKAIESEKINAHVENIQRLVTHYKIAEYGYHIDGKAFLEKQGIKLKWEGDDIHNLAKQKCTGRLIKPDTAFNKVLLSTSNAEDIEIKYSERYTASSDGFMHTILYSKLRKWADNQEKARLEDEANKKPKELRVKVTKKIWKRVFDDFASIGITKKMMWDETGHNYYATTNTGSALPENKFIPVKIKYKKNFPNKEIPFVYFEKVNVPPKHGTRYILLNIAEGMKRLRDEKKIKRDVVSEYCKFNIDHPIYYNRSVHEDGVSKLVEFFRIYLPDFVLMYKEKIDRPTSQPNLNVDFFRRIDSNLKAYMLGHIYADGYVQIEEDREYPNSVIKKITLVHSLDEEVLIDAFIKAINGNLESKKYRDNHVDLVFASRRFVTHLEKKGCTQGKSKTMRLPLEHLKTREHVLSFLLGFYDGDGSKNTHSISSGSLEFLKDIKKYFNIESKIITETRFKKNVNDKTKTISHKMSIGGELFREMMKIAEITDGIPNKKQFPKKRLWDPYTGYKSRPKSERTIKNVSGDILEILTILNQPNSFTSLKRITKANEQVIKQSIDKLRSENRIEIVKINNRSRYRIKI